MLYLALWLPVSAMEWFRTGASSRHSRRGRDRARTPRRGDLGSIPDSPFHDLLSAVRSCPDRAIDAGPAGSVPSSVRRATSFTRRFARDAPSNSRASISPRSSAGRRSFVPTHFAQRVRSASRSSPRAIVERWHSGISAEIQWTPGHHDRQQRYGQASMFTVEHGEFERARREDGRQVLGRLAPRPSGLRVSAVTG